MTTIANHLTVRHRIVSSRKWITRRLDRLPSVPTREARRWSWWLVPAAILGVLLPLTVSAITGNLAIPHNDSWAASKIAETFANTGTIKLVNWNQMSMIGQAVMLGPLGSSIVNQQVAIGILSLILLYSAYDAVSLTLPTGRAGLAVLTLAIWPGFALIATSFMTDIPEITAAFVSLAIGRRAFARDSPRLLYLALLVAFWGTTVREEAILAPVAFVIYGLIRVEGRARLTRVRLLAASGVFILALLVFLVWRSGLPEANNPPFVTGDLATVLQRAKLGTPELYFTLAFGISPAVVLTARPWRWSHGSWWAASLVALLAYEVGLGPHVTTIISGNYFTPNGAYPPVIGAAGAGRTIFGGATWMIVDDVAALSGALLAGTLFERWRWHRADPTLMIFTALSAIAIAVFGWIGLGLYDRYFIVLIPGVLSIVLARPTPVSATATADAPAARPSRSNIPRRLQLGLTTLTALFVVGMSGLTAANAFAYDIARWHFAQHLQKTTGMPADQIDPGIEWMGTYTAAPVKSDPQHLLNVVDFEGLWSKNPTCVNVMPVPPNVPTHWKQVGVVTYKTFLLSGSSNLYGYYTDERGPEADHARGCPKLK